MNYYKNNQDLETVLKIPWNKMMQFLFFKTNEHWFVYMIFVYLLKHQSHYFCQDFSVIQTYDRSTCYARIHTDASTPIQTHNAVRAAFVLYIHKRMLNEYDRH